METPSLPRRSPSAEEKPRTIKTQDEEERSKASRQPTDDLYIEEARVSHPRALKTAECSCFALFLLSEREITSKQNNLYGISFDKILRFTLLKAENMDLINYKKEACTLRVNISRSQV